VARAAHLLGPAGRELLEQAVSQWPPDSDEAKTLRDALGLPQIVKLGK
jgi:hypothetical protein